VLGPPATPPKDYLLCKPCHYSCSTCKVGYKDNMCLSCNSTAKRVPNPLAMSLAAPGRCVCQTNRFPYFLNYTDIGKEECVLCSDAMPGCLDCTSSSYCLLCNTIKYEATPNSVTHKCICLSSAPFMASGYCLTFSGCL
jgi:hypothetical protein